MNIRTHIQTLLICTMTLAAQGQSVVDPGATLPRSVQLRGGESRWGNRPSGRIQARFAG